MIESISAITLATHEMPRAVRFYRALEFEILHGGEASSFTSFRAGQNYLNLIAQPPERRWSWWGRVIFYVSDVDALHQRALAAGYRPSTSPRDAEWGDLLPLNDPDGHEPVSRGRAIDVDESRLGRCQAERRTSLSPAPFGFGIRRWFHGRRS